MFYLIYILVSHDNEANHLATHGQGEMHRDMPPRFSFRSMKVREGTFTMLQNLNSHDSFMQLDVDRQRDNDASPTSF